MNAYKKAIASLAACIIASAAAVGCNTFRGAGQDIQDGGKAIENSAEGAQSSIERTDRERTISIMSIADSGGIISPAGGTRVPYGARQTFTIKPYPGYRVQDVSVDGRSLGAISVHTFENVRTNHTISAQFAVQN